MNDKTPKRIFHIGSLLAISMAALFAIFMLLQLTARLLSGMETTTAVQVTADNSFTTTGWFFREETVADAVSSETVRHIVHSGEKVQKNAALAVVYTDTEALEISQQVGVLSDEVELLTAAIASTTSGSDTSRLDREIAAQISSLSAAVQSGVTTGVQNETTALRNLCLRRSASELDSATLSARLSALTTERDSLEQQLAGRSVTIASPASGYFSDIVDGLEGELTLERMETITVEELKELERTYEEGSGGNQLGKIIQNFRWYFVTVVPTSEISELEAGDSLRLRFSQVEEDIPVTVYAIRAERGADEAVLVLSGMDVTPELVTMRHQQAEVIYSSYTGIQVPKSAVRIQTDSEGNQQQGVYILTGNVQRFKPIEILYEADDYYVVQQGITSEDTGLVVGDNIIVRARGLDEVRIVS